MIEKRCIETGRIWSDEKKSRRRRRSAYTRARARSSPANERLDQDEEEERRLALARGRAGRTGEASSRVGVKIPQDENEKKREAVLLFLCCLFGSRPALRRAFVHRKSSFSISLSFSRECEHSRKEKRKRKQALFAKTPDDGRTDGRPPSKLSAAAANDRERPGAAKRPAGRAFPSASGPSVRFGRKQGSAPAENPSRPIKTIGAR